MPTPLDKFPPFLCRAVARNSTRTKALTVEAIATASGLTKRTVQRLSNKTSWDGISVEVAFSFATACGIDLINPKGVTRRKVTWTKRLMTRPELLLQWQSQNSGDYLGRG